MEEGRSHQDFWHTAIPWGGLLNYTEGLYNYILIHSCFRPDKRILSISFCLIHTIINQMCPCSSSPGFEGLLWIGWGSPEGVRDWGMTDWSQMLQKLKCKSLYTCATCSVSQTSSFTTSTTGHLGHFCLYKISQTAMILGISRFMKYESHNKAIKQLKNCLAWLQVCKIPCIENILVLFLTIVRNAY